MKVEGEEPLLAATLQEPLPSPTLELEGIFRQFHGQVFSAAYRVTGSSQDAEDVLQTVFVRLLKRQDDIDLQPSPGAYLHRAAVKRRAGPNAFEVTQTFGSLGRCHR